MLEFRPMDMMAARPHEKVRRIRYFIFLKDVLLLAVSAFGGPQAHLALFFDKLVKKRGYVTDDELLELNALCSILPGPTSTQTITAIGFKIGGPGLAYLTLIIWITPAVLIMTAAALGISYLQENKVSLTFTRFIQPMAVGFMVFAGWQVGRKVFTNPVRIAIGLVAAIAAFAVRAPYVAPILLLGGAAATAIQFQKLERQQHKEPLRVQWANFALWLGIFLAAAALGALTRWLPVRLFENFYRNGSLIFGGGQVLVPLMFTEFVLFRKKQYLSAEEFLSGYAVAQVVPGPVFAFTAFIGTLAMREYGFFGQLLGSFVATAGIFLPGTFLIFFVYRFWNQLKQYRVVRASLEGINAAATGLIASAAVQMLMPYLDFGFQFSSPTAANALNVLVVAATFSVLRFTKVAPPMVIALGLMMGFVFS